MTREPVQHDATTPRAAGAGPRCPAAARDAGPGGRTRVTPAAERGHGTPPGHTAGDKWRATLRCGPASLTETVGRRSFEQDGRRRAGEGAR
ncbi:DUF6380 family protein [Streptomyces sp. NPDC007991]|uniref:DUF6380 family protein n=1 Tax=Streptomyces sp. NPDC007991 TaxID=3364803 RepID=UPI0036EE07E4